MQNKEAQKLKKKRNRSYARRARARDILWHRGDLSWKYHAGQEVIEKAYRKVKRKMFVANCARRFGKTFWLVAKAIECAINCKNTLPRIKIATQFMSTMEEFLIPAFEVLLEDCPDDIWAGWELGYSRSKRKFTFLNGAEIKLVGLEKNPNGLRGNYADLVIIDEAGNVDNLAYLYSSVIAPMTLTRPGPRS